MSKKRPTNTEFVKSLMEFSRTGALSQMFIIAAIDNYSKATLKATEADWDCKFIHFPAWQDCAREIQEKLEARPK